MTVQVNIYEAKTKFSKLVNRAIAGEEIIIAKSGKPVAKLVPIETALKDRIPDRRNEKLLLLKILMPLCRMVFWSHSINEIFFSAARAWEIFIPRF